MASNTFPRARLCCAATLPIATRDVLSKEQEEALLYRDMQSDAVQQVVRRLQVAKLDLGSPAKGQK